MPAHSLHHITHEKFPSQGGVVRSAGVVYQMLKNSLSRNRV
jgi:hypothetical protein